MDKFLLAENPMSDSDEIYIVHALPPFALIAAIVGAFTYPDADQRIFQSFAFRNIDGVVEDHTLIIVYTEASHDQAEKLLSKAWRWYRSYMEWEDKNISDE